MQILNLADRKKGTIDYEIVPFSDSQAVVNLLGKYADGVSNVEESVKIISRFSWVDLQLIIGANQALKEAGFKYIHLYVPYFLGARADRKFGSGGYNYLKVVICPIINSQGFKSVTVMDPHSHCLEMGLERIKIVSNAKVVKFALEDLKASGIDESKLVWLIPDKGAVDKAYNTIKEVSFGGHVIECTKKRDIKTGAIVETNIPAEVIFEGDTCLIVDDICDGGYTFLGLVAKAKERGAGKIYLVVTHGIFSKGVSQLLQLVEGIYCTDSVKTINLSTIPESKVNVKQLNVLVEWRIGKVISI